jgi:hypothetical protein
VTLTDTEEQRIKKREEQVEKNVAAKKLKDTMKKRHKKTNGKTKRNAMDANGDFDRTVHGSHKVKPSEKTLVKIGISKIPGAGRGVFANTDLVQDQVVTRCDGTLHSHQSTDIVQNQYTIEIVQEKKKGVDIPSSLFLWGIQHPKLGRGLGTFINCPKRGQRANCIFDVDRNRKIVWIKAIKNIKKDKELVVIYGRGFRIPKGL